MSTPSDHDRFEPWPPWIPAAKVAAAFEFPRAPAWMLRARPWYVMAGVVWCALCVGPMTAVELGGLGAGIAFLIGLPAYWRVTGWAVVQPAFLGLAAWAAWMAVGLLHTPNVEKGLWEGATLRFAGTLVTLWPVLTQRRKLIAGLCLGFLAANLSQATLAIIRAGGWAHLDYSTEFPDRNAGWWVHPAVCGYMLVAALGLHLPAAAMGRGRVRLAGIGGCVATWMGVFATGTRGAMLGGAVLTLLVIGVHAVRSRGKRGLAFVAAAGLVLAIAGGAWLGFSARGRETVSEVRRALVERDLQTWTGARVQFARWAGQMWSEHPLIGHGPGSYEHWVRRHVPPEDVHHVAPQAHNLLLHIGATLGLLGVLIAAWIGVSALIGGFAGLPRRPEGWEAYDAGPGWALVGMLLCSPFDVLYVNSPPGALLSVLLALCLCKRPAERPGWR